MRILVGMLAFVVLAGCMARPMSEVRQDGPYKILHSNKTDKALAECVQYEWQNQALFGVTPQATLQAGRDSGYTVLTAGSEYFVDFKQDATGTDARYYAIARNWIAKARLEKLQSCI